MRHFDELSQMGLEVLEPMDLMLIEMGYVYRVRNNLEFIQKQLDKESGDMDIETMKKCLDQAMSSTATIMNNLMFMTKRSMNFNKEDCLNELMNEEIQLINEKD